MNQYAQQARTFYEQNLPSLASSMTDQEWTRLGERLNQQIGDLAAQLAGPDQPNEAHLDKVARLNTARMRATEIVMHDEVYSRVSETDPTADSLDTNPENPDSREGLRLDRMHQAMSQAQEALLDAEDAEDDRIMQHRRNSTANRNTSPTDR